MIVVLAQILRGLDDREVKKRTVRRKVGLPRFTFAATQEVVRQVVSLTILERGTGKGGWCCVAGRKRTLARWPQKPTAILIVH